LPSGGPALILSVVEATVHWLNFWSAVTGFLSVIALAAATIGVDTFKDFLKQARATESRLGDADPALNLPPIAVMSGFALVVVFLVFIVAFPEYRTQFLNIKSIFLLFVAISAGGWVLAFAVMVLIHSVIVFALSLSWLETKKVAGWIGFALLTLSFILLVTSTSIEVFNIEPPNAATGETH
jgi:hypothetical protein